MYNQAIDKLRDEMAANPKDTYIQYVGDYLTDYLQKHQQAAPFFLQEGKTIKGSIEAMEKHAKGKGGRCVCVAPDEGLKIVMDYYGIGAEPAKSADVCGFNMFKSYCFAFSSWR